MLGILLLPFIYAIWLSGKCDDINRRREYKDKINQMDADPFNTVKSNKWYATRKK